MIRIALNKVYRILTRRKYQLLQIYESIIRPAFQYRTPSIVYIKQFYAHI